MVVEVSRVGDGISDSARDARFATHLKCVAKRDVRDESIECVAKRSPSIGTHDADFVIAAVADVNVARAVDEHAVRTGQSACESRAVRAVAQFAVAHNRLDHSGLTTDDTDRVTFRVSEINVSVRSEGNAFGAGEPRLFGRSAVAGIPFLPRAGHVMQR